MTFATGELIGNRYRLEELIGSGGMGDVFRARDTLLERPVALKLVDIGDPRRREEITNNFLREARISAAIAHRNVVQILDFGTHAETIPFIVMELLEGESLADVLGRGERLSFAWIVELLEQVLEGLAAAHDAGVVHRDLKPENIFLVRTRSGAYPKILDFGISKLTDERGAARITTTQGHVVGTPAYMSPEQARGVKFIDKRTDVYSAGVVLYELLSGEMPFYSENPGDLMVMIVTKEAEPLSLRVPGIPKALSDVVARAMHKKPDERYASARELQAALQSASAELRTRPEALSLEGRPRPAWLSFRSRAEEPRAANRERPLEVTASQTPLKVGGLVARPLAGKGRRYLLTALSLALVGSALGITVALFDRSSASAVPRYIVVQADMPRGETSGATLVQTSGGAPEAASAEQPATALEPQRAPARRADGDGRERSDVAAASRLAESFKRQKKGVVACVNAHSAEAERTPKLAVRIALAANGVVQSARVLPAEIAGSTMGKCIEQAVRAMQFPRQRSTLAFEVPLTARKEE